MTTKNKTQSFAYSKSEREANKNKQASQVSIGFDQHSEKGALEYNQLSRTRFLRKDLDKDEIFDPRVYITNELTYEDVVDLKEVFDTYDSSDVGVMVPNDLKLFLQQNGYNPNKTTVYDIVAEFDEGETGGISFKDFMRAMGTKPTQNQSKKQITTIFKKFDKEGKGYVDLGDLREVNKRIKENLDEETLQEIISKSEGAKDGRIFFEDFYRMMSQGFSW